MYELKEGQAVWIKVSHDDKGKRGVVKYKAEEPDSYWIETDKRLVRRTRKHLRRLPEIQDERNNTEHGECDSSKDNKMTKNDNQRPPPREPSSRRAKKVLDSNYIWF